ncbi:MAG: acetyltransferase [Rhodobacteraceae bacterium HLUCCA08]|nr:MAG: acetyltransferase [Rhodobacteraceae bacterium HLUCCA08]
MSSDPDAATPRMPRLRPFRQDDLEVLRAQLGDPRVSEWLAAIAQPFDLSQAMAFMDFAADPAQKVRALEIDGVVIGGLCVGDALWYWLAPAHWGRGHMTRTLRTACADHFASPRPPLTATCREDNTASRAVLGRLGFSPCPQTRRMFFHGARTSYPCRDHVMTPEQWHLLNPPCLRGSRITLRPARQTDLPAVQRLLEGAPAGGTWPRGTETGIRGFIETHRFRGTGPALWMIENDERRTLGMALSGHGVPAIRCPAAHDDDGLIPDVLRLLSN